MNTAADFDSRILEQLEKFAWDPLSFVHWAYPWGEDGTILEKEEGPDVWQEDILTTLAETCIDTQRLILDGKEAPSVRIAVRSGHGIGKTALVSWITHWFMSTKPNPQLVVTANTKTQLDSKTWRELNKWHKLSIHEHWFTWTGSRFYQKQNPGTWCANAIPWSEDNPDAFAGTHEKWTLVIFDEASAIADSIWDVTEGAMTTPGAIWLCFGNPTRNTGKFSECFKPGSRWSTREIDSRLAKRTNKAEIKKWIEEYGEDSDFVRVRVKGQEPRQEVTQMIPQYLINEAYGKKLDSQVYNHAAKVMGIDVARQGGDASVIRKRQGLNANYNAIKFSELSDLMVFADICAREIDEWKPDAVFIDMVGFGAGVYDRLRQLKYDVIGVNGKTRAIDQNRYSNRRTEMNDAIRHFLKDGGALPEDKDLKADLAAPQAGFDNKGRIQIERKVDTMKRLKRSCDDSDALALTFAEPVALKKEDDFEDWLAKKAAGNYVNSPNAWMAA